MAPKKVIKQVKKIVASVTDNFEVVIDDLQLPFEVDDGDPFVKLFLKSARALRITPRLKGSDGATVISFFKKHGIKAFATGFGKSGTLHADDEFAEVRTLYKGAVLLEKFIKDYDQV
jgi:acetylornithine deacetylase/succinyl-diaminopimelate desuccinylase-like protein